MSHEIVKSIAIKDDKVYLTSADSSLRPLTFSRWECTSLSKLLSEKGQDALYAEIGKEMWNGNLEIRQGSKLCKLFLEARNAFPSGMGFMNFDGKAAGEFLGKMVTSLEKDPFADLSGYVKEALALRNNRDYILEAAHRTGHNFLNCASHEIQQDRAFALEVLRAGDGAAWFEYPSQFKEDKDFALEALKLNGCFYRNLGDTVKADREVIMEAFREAPDKKYHEHLPDTIPLVALFDFEKDILRPSWDKKFIMELLEACPSMHMNRVPYLLNIRDIALKWTQVGKFFPHSVKELPKEYLTDKEFQSILTKRFEGTDKYNVLEKCFADLDIQLLGREPIQSYFYTFGTSSQFPYKKGWVEVQAEDRPHADALFRMRFPDVHEGILNCSFVYPKDRFEEILKTDYVNLPDWKICHELISADPYAKSAIAIPDVAPVQKKPPLGDKILSAQNRSIEQAATRSPEKEAERD